MATSRALVVFLLAPLGTACAKATVELAPDLALAVDFEGSPRAAAVAEVDHDRKGACTYAPGVEGHALHVDGSGASVTYDGIAALPLDDALTLEFFFAPDAWRNPYDRDAVLESLVSHSDVFTLALQPDSWLLSARLRTVGQESAVALVGGVVTPGTWHHAALVLDPASASGRLYLDGEVVAEAPISGRLALLEGVPLTVGTWAGKNQAYTGRIDSLRVWSRALTASELAERVRALPGPSGS